MNDFQHHQDPLAALSWCLCLILTLMIAGSRRPVVTRTVDSDPWWGTKEAREIRRAAEQYRAARDFASAETVDQRGYELALGRHNESAASAFLTAIGAARLVQFRYRSALDAFLHARDLAARSGDLAAPGIIAVNLSSLYLQTWDIESALAAAEEGVAKSEAMPRAYCRLPLLMQIGRLHQAIDDDRASEFFEEAIDEARLLGDMAQEARAWDFLGEERLRQGREATPEQRFDTLSLAERYFNEAFRLRVMRVPADLPFSFARLGAVKLALGELASAERFTDRALAEGSAKGGLPRYLLLHQRGAIRRARGDIAGALKDFEAAVDLAGMWCMELVPAQNSLIAANVELEKRIFRSFIETSAFIALQSGNSRVASASFQAVELNRAASFRQDKILTRELRKRLPPEYWAILAEMRAEASRNAADGTAAKRASHSRFVITEMEAKAGVNFFSNNFENFRGQSSLIHFQQGLGKSELLLSVYLGEQRSYLWAVIRETLTIHRLPAADEFRTAVQEFRDAVRNGATHKGEIESGSDAEQMGRRLYAWWFGGLNSQEAAKSKWLLSLDGALFQMPFGALMSGVRGGKMTNLVEQHSVQVIPGALSLMDGTAAGRGSPGVYRLPAAKVLQPTATFQKDRFLGVADPVYNTADPRWLASQWDWTLFRRWSGYRSGITDGIGQRNRLVGSANEIEASARSWAAGSASSLGAASILIGSDARRDRFLELAAHAPAIIHLATHVLKASGWDGTRTNDALIVFGRGSTGRLESLSTSEIGMLSVPGAVVSMTGCASGEGDIKAGANQMGLTRAWELAGARAVIATGWPVDDTSGDLFASSYRYLRSSPPAEALRRSQVEMISSGGWQSAPRYWASYQVTGGGH